MKIVVLVTFLTGGGAERVAALWAKGFAQNGHQVTVLLSHDHMPVTYKLPAEVKVAYYASHEKNNVLRGLKRMWRLHQILRHEKPNAVIDVEPRFERFLATRGIGCLTISTEHNSFERPVNAGHKLSWKKKYLLNRLYDHVTVLTQADKNVIGNRLKHVSVLPNPLALTPIHSVPAKKKVVLAVGRKDDWHCKGFDNLIRAWAQMAKSAEGWKLQIVGSSPKGGQKYLEHLSLECGVVESVEFPEYQDDILPYYQRAEIFVLSSRYEGFGLVLIEAMSQGCACIACDYKGRQSEIVTNGTNGVTCEPDNVEDIADAIKSLIADDELRTQLQTNAIHRALDFSLANIMKKWEEIFKQCNISGT